MTMFCADQFNNNNSRFCGLGFVVMSQLNSLTSSSTSTGPGSDHHLLINNNNNIVGSILMADEDESSSKDHNDNNDVDDGDQEWLQLSIGGRGGGGQQVKQQAENLIIDSHHHHHHHGSNSSTNLVELQLMPSSGSNINNNDDDNNNNNNITIKDPQILGRIPEFRAPRPVTTTLSPYLIQQQQQHNYNNPAAAGIMTNFMPHHHHQQDINWALVRPIPISIAGAVGPSSSSSSGSYFQTAGGVDNNMSQPGPPASLDFRVMRRPHSGIWFMLQASLNQEKQPFLPQISKSYLRIKDGRMVIGLVIKYLANKLRLENESEIELRCKGQKLEPFLTLQHVRDKIWSNNPRDFITLLPNSSTTHHIMVLQYARTASN